MAVSGIIFMMLTFEYLLLRKKKVKNNKYATEPEKHVYRVQVLPNSPCANKTILGANLRGLSDTYLASVTRGPRYFAAVRGLSDLH